MIGSGNAMAAPEYGQFSSVQAKLTHVFSPSTYIDVMLNHTDLYTRSEFDPDNPNAVTTADKPVGVVAYMGNPFFQSNAVSDVFKNNVQSLNTVLKADFVSQVKNTHQIKAGAMFSLQDLWWELHLSQATTHILLNDVFESNRFKPWEAGLYIQDKIEYEGMIINLGLRMDMYNVNKTVSSNVFDPYQMGAVGPGTVPGEIGYPHFDKNGSFAVKSPTQVALSPRLGISHPITDNTVLHFMYGHFNMRPPWMMLGSNPGSCLRQPIRDIHVPDPQTMDPAAGDIVNYHMYTNFMGNIQLEYEKVVQYEIGIKQNIVDLLGIDVTAYYKEGKDLAIIGLDKSNSFVSGFGTTTTRYTELYGQPDPNMHRYGKDRLGTPQVVANMGY